MKILAVASCGGHWEELIRITNQLSKRYSIAYACTRDDVAISIPEGHNLFVIDDFNRNSSYKIFSCFFKAFKIILKEKPNIIISTGAAPGMITLFAGWLMRKKCIWIDSIANIHKLSMSCRLLIPFNIRIYTQWEHLQTARVIYAGSILGQAMSKQVI